MVSQIAEVSGVAGAVLALRYLTQLIVVVWSLRADEQGRKHALQLLELLHGRRKPP